MQKVANGRPSEYTDDIFYNILGEVSDGKSLKSICSRDDMPDKATFYRWLDKDQRLCDKYARAKEDSSDALADDIQDISDKVLVGTYEANNARVAIDAKKWIASKLKPKKYGDKMDITSDGKVLPTPILGGLSRNELNDDIKD